MPDGGTGLADGAAVSFGRQTVPIYYHSYQPRPSGFDLTSFNQGSASKAIIGRVKVRRQINTNAYDTWYANGYVSQLRADISPATRTTTTNIGNPAVTSNDSGVAAPLWCVSGGTLYGMVQGGNSPSQWGACQQLADNVPEQKYYYGPMLVLPISSFYESHVDSNGQLFEGTYQGINYTFAAFFNSWANPPAVEFKMYNPLMFPGASGGVDSITGIPNGGAAPLYPTDCPIGDSAGLPISAVGGVGAYMVANSFDSRKGWNYSLFMQGSGSATQMFIVQWRMKDPSTNKLECAKIRNQSFNWNTGDTPLDNSYFHYQKVQSTEKGFLFQLNNPYTTGGRTYYHIFLQRDGRAYYLIDWTLNFQPKDVNPAWTTQTFTNASIRGAHLDKDGFFFVEILDTLNTGNLFVGASRTPLFQNGMPKLNDPSIIPVQRIGCFNPCNTFPTYSPGQK